MTEYVRELDRFIVLFLNQFARRNEWVDNVIAIFAGPFIISGILLMAVIAYCWFRRRNLGLVVERQYIIAEMLGACQQLRVGQVSFETDWHTGVLQSDCYSVAVRA